MKKRIISFFIIICFATVSFSQVNDSLIVRKEMDIHKIVPRFKAIDISDILEATRPMVNMDSITLTAADSLRIKLDSLLLPFYDITYDPSVKDYAYTPKYRMTIRPIKEDTIYVPIPKRNGEYIRGKRRLRIDPIEVLNPITRATIKTQKYADDPVWWKNKNSIGLDISEATFLNWNAGGNNSISGLVKVNLVRNYKKLHLLWNNEIFLRYGLNQQQDKGLRKTDDKFQVNSTFGYRKDTISNWFYSVKLNFNTQFTNGYSYPDTSTPISRFFAPAYLFLGAGTHYELKNQKFSLYLSPITLKSTFVNDKALSDEGAFGVEKGERSRHEFGTLIQTEWDKVMGKNVVMTNKLSLYSDYLNKFGNIDINWELHFNFAINKHFKANLGGYLLYDDDIKFKEDKDNDGVLETSGARVQLKQLLGIGVQFVF
ncbi:MAG: DUF3078 domain-containing protein [Flavobacteriaceae bacterium]|jgi:hypothetical protein